MKKVPHPLEKEFDMVDETVIDEFNDTIEIPDDPTLDTIIELALKAYKEQLDVISLVDPKSRIKCMEIAEKFLGQAKDAMHKKEMIKIQKQRAAGKKPKNESVPLMEGNSDTEQPAKTYTREELLAMNKKAI